MKKLMRPDKVFTEFMDWRAYRKNLEKENPEFAEMWKRRNRANDALGWWMVLGFLAVIAYMILVIIWAGVVSGDPLITTVGKDA